MFAPFLCLLSRPSESWEVRFTLFCTAWAEIPYKFSIVFEFCKISLFIIYLKEDRYILSSFKDRERELPFGPGNSAIDIRSFQEESHHWISGDLTLLSLQLVGLIFLLLLKVAKMYRKHSKTILSWSSVKFFNNKSINFLVHPLF